MSNWLSTLDGKIAPLDGPMSGFELMYALLLAMERMAAAMERSATVHEAMLEKMSENVETVAHAELI